MIALIDYGVGNMRSVEESLRKTGAAVTLTSEAALVEDADSIVLPGVGAFRSCYENMRKTGLLSVLEKKAGEGVPILGICVGLQLLFTESEEFGRSEGLGFIKGKVVRFAGGLKIPHMGWNEIRTRGDNPLLEGIHDMSFMYFAHSYYPVPAEEGVVSAVTEYGVKFPSVVRKENIFGFQFHPEKSGDAGLAVLRNFCALRIKKHADKKNYPVP